MTMFRYQKKLVNELFEWLDGRMPSEAVKDFEKDFSNAPIAAFAKGRHRRRRIGSSSKKKGGEPIL